jgi:[ribosomal protein S5]-alanine N-acetyltransferase
MIDHEPLPTVGERIVLRRLTPDDLLAFQAYRTDPDIGRYQGWSATSGEKALEFLSGMNVIALLVPEQWCQIGIADASTNELIGDISVCIHENALEAEIGLSIRRQSQRKGLVTEAVHSVIEMLFANPAVQRVFGVTDQRNTASIRLLERVGMKKVAVQNTVFRDEPCVEFTYSVTRQSA